MLSYSQDTSMMLLLFTYQVQCNLLYNDCCFFLLEVEACAFPNISTGSVIYQEIFQEINKMI